MGRSKTHKYSGSKKLERSEISTRPVAPGEALGGGAFRMDGWQNLTTGLNDPNRDVRLRTTAARMILSYTDCVELIRGDDMCARIIERPVEEMLREGYEIATEEGKEATEDLCSAAEELGWDACLQSALEWKRGYGGAGILLGANDGERDLSKPLREDRIRSIDYLTPLQSIELQGVEYYSDPLSPKFGQTAVYRVVPQLASTFQKMPFLPLVHESRVIQFQGVVTSRRQMRENFGWGDSALVRVIEIVRDFQTAWMGTSAVLQKFNQTVFKFANLSEALAADDGSNQLLTRLQMMDYARSIIKALVIDKDDDFQVQQTPVTGLAELLERFEHRLAAAADMPRALLMGDSATGLGDSGQKDVQFWNKRIRNMQKKEATPQCKRFFKLLQLAKQGPTNGVELENWSIKWNPLDELNALDESQRRLNDAQRFQIYVANGIASGEEIADSALGGDEYSSEIVLDRETRDGIDDAIDRRVESDLGTPDPTDLMMPGQNPLLVGADNRKQVGGTPKNKDGSPPGTTNSGQVGVPPRDNSKKK